jgi:hypothetical protein
MADTSKIELTPPYRGRLYFLHGWAEPSEQQPDEFSVNIHYKDAEAEETIQVARVDTSHGYTHFDQLYRRDQPKKEVDWGYWEAFEKLSENWRTYAENYEKAHG